jgi:PDDEXK-like domain of unknown function (DUF3799)
MVERQGIYFDLAEDEYHADPALGSTDIKNLLKSGPDYWWNSSLNPRHADEPTPQQEYGKALHLLVLEGQQIFKARYARRPDNIKTLTARLKAELFPNGEVVLEGADYDRILIANALIAQTNDLAAAFEGGMSEVSVFWVENDVRMKARFDYLKTRGIGDLKSIRNIYGRPFPEACGAAILTYRYDIQAAHYLRGREELPRFVELGWAYGDHDRDLLNRIAANNKNGFQWVFFQADSAPNVLSWSLSPGHFLLKDGYRDRVAAIATYNKYMAKFGAQQMWLMQEQVRELTIDDLPRWYR